MGIGGFSRAPWPRAGQAPGPAEAFGDRACPTHSSAGGRPGARGTRS